jgi:hypothetical protein
MEERTALADRMAEDTRANGRLKSASSFEAQSEEMRGCADTI